MSSAEGTTPQAQRELVFCHECHEEWYRDEHGLVCPREECRSDFVEIVENNNDPRRAAGPSLQDILGLPQGMMGMPGSFDIDDDDADMDDHHEHNHEHRHHHHHPRPPFPVPPLAGASVRRLSPGGATIIRAEGPGFGYVTTSTYSARISGPGGVSRPVTMDNDEIVANLFATMFRNIMGDQNYSAASANEGGNNTNNNSNNTNSNSGNTEERGEEGNREGANRGEGARTGGSGPTPFPSILNLGFGPRLNPRDADSPQAGEPPHVPDLQTFLGSLLGPGAMGGGDALPAGFLARVFGIPPGGGGDYVYSQAELDRIVSQLMEQHSGNAPPPAAKEDIDALPRIKVTKEMVDDSIDCAVCKEDLLLDEEVARLPCKHTYHFECVSKWLETHDTCPICRHPITPEEKRQQNQNSSSSASSSSTPPNNAPQPTGPPISPGVFISNILGGPRLFGGNNNNNSDNSNNNNNNGNNNQTQEHTHHSHSHSGGGSTSFTARWSFNPLGGFGHENHSHSHSHDGATDGGSNSGSNNNSNSNNNNNDNTTSGSNSNNNGNTDGDVNTNNSSNNNTANNNSSSGGSTSSRASFANLFRRRAS